MLSPGCSQIKYNRAKSGREGLMGGLIWLAGGCVFVLVGVGFFLIRKKKKRGHFSLTFTSLQTFCPFQVISLVLGSLFRQKEFWSTPAQWDSLSLFGCLAAGWLPLARYVTLNWESLSPNREGIIPTSQRFLVG